VNFQEAVEFLFTLFGSESHKRDFAGQLLAMKIPTMASETTKFLLKLFGLSPSALFSAVRSGDVKIVVSMLEKIQPEFVNRVYPDGTVLCVAAELGNIEMINALLTFPGIDPTLPNYWQETPFIIAAQFKYFHVLRRLVEFTGSRFLLDPNHVNRTFLAAFQPHSSSKKEIFTTPSSFDWIDLTSDMIPFFLKISTIDVNYRFDGNSILIVAATTGNSPLLNAVLLVPGVDVNITDFQGNTPFILAAKGRRFECLRILAMHPGTDVNHRNYGGRSALCVAASAESPELLEFVISHPTFDASLSNAPLAVVKAIMKHRDAELTVLMGLDFDINEPVQVRHSSPNSSEEKPKHTMTAFVGAAIEMDQVVVNQVAAHPRFDAKRSGVEQTLFISAKSRRLPLFQFFLGLVHNNVNFRNENNETLFVYACFHSSVPILQTIIQSSTFRPTPREIGQAMAAVVRANQDTFVPILANVLHCDWNAPFPPDVNGRRMMGRLKPGRTKTRYEVGHTEPPLPDLCGGIPPLIAAARFQRYNVRQALMALPDVDVNVRGEYGQTLLFEFTGQRYGGSRFNTFEKICGHPRIDLNAQDRNGFTALMRGVLEADWKFVEFLLRKRVDVTLRNARGQTAWDLALQLAGVEPREQPADEKVFQQTLLSMVQRRKDSALEGGFDGTLIR
jgi:ankyrin repeat protein